MAVLSVEEVERSTFPLLSTIGRVNLFEFIQRLDALVVFTLLINMFFKISIFFYVAVIGMVDLFKLKNHQQIVTSRDYSHFFIYDDCLRFCGTY
ncbi:GerAB/ArcD/ProY family transporter [Alteribacillus bidgolensis]|uniref:GerAB/ArcD/ProY family transporter n=1 Tax=Alteribacillus bidgolensis TaxID=930129 RepID=UPI00349E84BF